MLGVKDDEMVQALSPDRADQALDVRILPGALRSREDLLHPKRRDALVYDVHDAVGCSVALKCTPGVDHVPARQTPIVLASRSSAL
jgi:hypothetical protein